MNTIITILTILNISSNFKNIFVLSLNDGLALTPPMGWRTWYAFGCEVNQTIMEKIMDLMTQPHSFGAIKNISLHDLGYQDVGLDDCWQKCGAGYNGSYHTKKGDPIVDETKFPDLGGMVSYGHARNLTVGWYGNNCVCSEHGFSKEDVELQIKGDVNATLKYKFDGIKLDGCGQKLDLQKYVDLFKFHGKKIVIENCHWGNDLRTPNSCPYHFARMSQDIIRTWEGFFLNLQTMARGNGLSGPGCWGYPDMLVVGDMIGKYYESRAHFGAWCVTSSPLILSFDLTNTALLKDVWSIIANKEAIAVNQAWDGDAGRLLYSWDPVDETSKDLPYYVWVLPCDDFDEEQQGWALKVHDEGAELRWRVEGDDVPICEVKHTKNLLRFPIEGSKLNNTNLGSLEMCMSMQKNVVPSFLQMWPCDEPVMKNNLKTNIIYNHTTGQLVSKSSELGGIKCLSPFSYNEANNAAAGLVLEDCVDNDQDRNAHVKQRFHFSGTKDPRGESIGRVLTGIQTTMCLSLKSSAPLNSNTLQMWAKRLPAGYFTNSSNDANIDVERDRKSIKCAAVFLINSDLNKSHSIIINNRILANIFQTTLAPKGLIKITDIWNQSLPLGKNGSNSKNTSNDPKEVKFIENNLSWPVTIPPRDSRFFIVELILENKKRNIKEDLNYADTFYDNRNAGLINKRKHVNKNSSSPPEIEIV